MLLNGHGGNELKPLTRQLHHRTDVFMCVCDWYRMAADLYPSIFEKPGEHADEVETSLGLAFFPELMHPERADDGAGSAVALRGDQPRLGEHHATVASGERQHRARRPESGDGGEGATADGSADATAGGLSGGIGGGGEG